MSGGTVQSRSGARPSGGVQKQFDVLPYVEGIAALMAGTANVIMQLSRPAVGYGVVESTVDSGKVTLHPLKRARTTLTYLAVATMGDEHDRANYRAAVNTSHRHVVSTDESPVEYNAFDPELQLWVAACIYWGVVDVWQKMHGPLDDARADALYEHSARFATTLQVRPEMWPPDRAAFEKYWTDSLAKVSIDAPVRDYLYGLMTLRHMPWIVRVTRGPNMKLLTTGFLPDQFRGEMRLTWTERDQRKFDRRVRLASVANNAMPPVIRRFPFNLFLWDMRRRVRTGRPLV